MLKTSSLIAILCLFSTNSIFSQIISVDNTLLVQDLIEDNLVEGCVEISNITSTINGTINGFSSFGFFERGTSNFPFQDGIMLSTGNANSGGNTTNDTPISDGNQNWNGDPDLETALGITNTFNATSIEFDFISVSNTIQFNYILASEEYFAAFPCFFSDGFAFLIKKEGTNDSYTNIALIPNTDIPVSVSTVHGEIVGLDCPAQNEDYFDGYNIGDTNYNGRTKTLTATANIIPNIKYHIKLVIADQKDELWDSAVFIEGHSFKPSVDLGTDVSTCAIDYEINGDIQNPLASYQWFQDGTLIAGETESSFNVTTSGNYSLIVTIPLSGSDCIMMDDIKVALSSEQTIGDISDFILCDSLNDSKETFVLPFKEPEILNAVPPGNYTITYHLTDEDAQNDTNPIIIPIENTSNPQPIYVRILDLDNGCITFTKFNLVLSPLPEITAPSPLEVCDDGIPDGMITIDLTQMNDEITLGDSSLIVSYHFNQPDANTGDNPIVSPYTSANETIYIRVENPNLFCTINTTSVTITVLERPIVNIVIPPLNACEDDNDGIATFDLTEIRDVLQSLTDVTITFYTTFENAETGENKIVDETNFTNTSLYVQVIFIRVENNTTGCATIVTSLVHTNILKTGTYTGNFQVCDDPNNDDGIADFNLSGIAAVIMNNLPDLTVTFYETENDRDNDLNPINQNVAYSVDNSNTPQKELFIKIETIDCIHKDNIFLIVSSPIVLQPVILPEICDTDSDGFAPIELTQFDALIIDTNGLSDSDVRVSYFTSNTEALFNINELPSIYETPSKTLFVRVSSITSICYDIIPIDIVIIPAPTVNTILDILICDDDQDAFSIINLDDIIPNIVADTTNLSISFHTTFDDFNNKENAITTPLAFNTETQTIYTRIESDITGCYALSQFNIIVNTPPESISISDFEGCEVDINQTSNFIFSLKDAEILNNQQGKQVFYFRTIDDANSRVNIIDKDINYIGTNQQTIFVRVENETDPNCFDVSSFLLKISPLPLFNPPTTLSACDDISNDEIETFNLNENIIEMSQGMSEDLTIRFYTSFDDADNFTNEIIDITNFKNTFNPQTIYVRIGNDTSCRVITNFDLNVIQVPNVLQLPSDLETCDVDIDGIVTFDLTVSESEILGTRDNNILVTYFETIENLNANINLILNPENYSNIKNPQTVYVKIANTISNCYVFVPLNLKINLPPTVNSVPLIEICDNETNTFNLTEITNILGLDTNATVSYHLNNNDAENNQNPIGNTFNYTLANHTLFIRAENINTLCHIVSSFNLLIYPNPIANTLPNLENCDDDYDLALFFNLSQQTPIVLGNQDPSQFVVTYYEVFNDAINNENQIIAINYNAINGQEIYVRIENIATGCFSTTSFYIIINRKPFVDIPPQVACLDDLPLTVIAGIIVDGDTYLWSTNETSSQIDITQMGDYWVTVTTPFGCQTTSVFNVIESEQATIEVVVTIDFSDPNNITLTASGIGDYMYVLDNGTPQESNIFLNVPIGDRILTIIDLNGCNKITIKVPIMDIPKFFSPNNDGYFDTWHISSVENLPGTTITIFDRYGKFITLLTSESAGWNGYYNGQMMPETDYWYIADVKKDGRTFQMKGHFTLRR